jgi:membrane protease YdiL (CAAX protease family)
MSRSGPGRLLVLGVVTLGLYIGLQLAIQFAARAAPARIHQPLLIAGLLVLCAVMLAAYVLGVRLMEKRAAVELSPRPGAINFLVGVALGTVLFTVVIAILVGLGNGRIGPFQGFAGIPIALALAVGAAVGEEIIFRGVVFRILEQSLGTGVAVLLSGALFGLLHAGNHGASAISTLAIALEAGVLLALAYAATGNLWLPIGLHLGWKFTEGGVFSQAVSGGTQHGVIEATLHGSPLMTGGAFGPEASLVAMAVSLAASLALAGVVARSGRWKPFRARPRAP